MILSTHGIVGSQIAQFTGLLDTYSGAAAAYSLRKLRSAYTGSAIRVRRASDNTEQNIGFTALGGLDTSSLTSFCSGTNGFVTTWYDQSGNARNATQTTASNQPQIVSSGSIILDNTKPAIQFDGSDDFLQNSSATIFSQPNTLISTARYTTTSGTRVIADSYNGANNRNIIYGTGGSFNVFAGTILPGGVLNTNQNLHFVNFNTTTNYYINSLLAISGNAGSNSYEPIRIGASSSSYMMGNIQEVIFYPSNQLSNRSGIEANINSFYSIY